MQKIHFYQFSFKHHPIAGLLTVCAALFPALSLFDLFDFLGASNVKWITAACYLLIAYQLGLRKLFYRHYVEWNKRGITVRVNSLWGLNFSFSDVKNVTFSEDSCTLQMYGGSTKKIDVTGIESHSKDRLLTLLNMNIR